MLRDFRFQNPHIFNGPSGHLFHLVNKINNACKIKNWKLVADLNNNMISELEKIRFGDLFDKFIAERHENYMMRAVLIYMRMVERLLRFIRASQERNWLLHLFATCDMAQDIYSMDRMKYRRCACLSC